MPRRAQGEHDRRLLPRRLHVGPPRRVHAAPHHHLCARDLLRRRRRLHAQLRRQPQQGLRRCDHDGGLSLGFALGRGKHPSCGAQLVVCISMRFCSNLWFSQRALRAARSRSGRFVITSPTTTRSSLRNTLTWICAMSWVVSVIAFSFSISCVLPVSLSEANCYPFPRVSWTSDIVRWFQAPCCTEPSRSSVPKAKRP